MYRSEAHFRLYRSLFLRIIIHSIVCSSFEIYKICTLQHRSKFNRSIIFHTNCWALLQFLFASSVDFSIDFDAIEIPSFSESVAIYFDVQKCLKFLSKNYEIWRGMYVCMIRCWSFWLDSFSKDALEFFGFRRHKLGADHSRLFSPPITVTISGSMWSVRRIMKHAQHLIIA